MNSVHVLVRLAADPEVRFTPGGQAVCNFRGAYTEKWTDKEGQKQERTSWLSFTSWGKTGEFIGQYFGKGGLILVDGKLQSREYEKDGQKRTAVEVVVERAHFAGNSGKEKGAAAPKREEPKKDAFDDGDVPF